MRINVFLHWLLQKTNTRSCLISFIRTSILVIIHRLWIERKYCIWVDYVCLNWYLFKRVIFLYLLFSLIPYEFLDLYISYLSALDYNKIHSNGILLNNNYETLITLLSMTVFNICETCNPFRWVNSLVSLLFCLKQRKKESLGGEFYLFK